MNLLDTTAIPDSFKEKSFWSKPQGTVGMVVAVILGIAGINLLFKLLPWIINFTTNLLHAVIVIAATVVISFILTRKSFWSTFSNLFEMAMEAITGLMIQIDPIGRMKDFIVTLKERLRQFVKNHTELKGVKINTYNYIQESINQVNNSMKLMSKAKEAGAKTQFIQESRKVARRKLTIETAQALYRKMEVVDRVMDKMREATEFYIADLEDEVDVKERQWKSLKAIHRTLSAALKIIGKDDREYRNFQRALDYTNEQCSLKLAEIDEFMQISTSFVDGVDLQNMVYEEDAAKMFDEWEKKIDSTFFSPDEKRALLLTDQSNQVSLLDMTEPTREGIPVSASQHKSDNKQTHILD